MNLPNKILETLKDGDLLCGSSIYNPGKNNDIDVWTGDESRVQYYKDLGYDVLLTHPKEFPFTFQCVGMDNTGKIHYFHKLAEESIREQVIYVNENGHIISKPTVMKYLALIPKWAYSDDAMALLIGAIPKKYLYWNKED